jgi:hypothetical protein
MASNWDFNLDEEDDEDVAGKSLFGDDSLDMNFSSDDDELTVDEDEDDEDDEFSNSGNSNTSGNSSGFSMKVILIGVAVLIVVAIAFRVVTNISNKKSSSESSSKSSSETTVDRSSSDDEESVIVDGKLDGSSNGSSSSLDSSSNSDDGYTEITGNEDIELNDRLSELQYTVTGIKHYAKANDNEIRVKTILSGAISGYTGNYTLEVPYSKGTKLKIGDNFIVYCRLGTYNGKTVIEEISY